MQKFKNKLKELEILKEDHKNLFLTNQRLLIEISCLIGNNNSCESTKSYFSKKAILKFNEDYKNYLKEIKKNRFVPKK